MLTTTLNLLSTPAAYLALGQILLNHSKLEFDYEYCIDTMSLLNDSEVFETALTMYPPAIQEELLNAIHELDLCYRDLFEQAHPNQDDFEVIAEAKDIVNRINTLL